MATLESKMAQVTDCDNSNRGWNDPPPQPYNSGATSGTSTPKHKLNKRVAFPQSGPSLPLSANNVQPASDIPVLPPAVYRQESSKRKSPELKSDVTPKIEPSDIEVLKNRFQSVLAQCENKFNKKTYAEITKRLTVMDRMWRDGKLNETIQQNLMKLSKALVDEDCDEANRIHLALAVDFAGLVSPWLVGVKHLIQQAKNANRSGTS